MYDGECSRTTRRHSGSDGIADDVSETSHVILIMLAVGALALAFYGIAVQVHLGM